MDWHTILILILPWCAINFRLTMTHHPPRLISDYLAGKKSQNKNFDDHIRTI